MHLFSMTCKVDAVMDRFVTYEERCKAIEWFRRHRIRKVYLESYRHGRMADLDVLRKVRDHFQSVGLLVCGCITPTKLSERKSESWCPEIVPCFSDPATHSRLQTIVEQTARVFDSIIFDDFFFHACSCPFCEAEKGKRSWAEYRNELMPRLASERIIQPARAINPRLHLILKYPNWYEAYDQNGYPLSAETALFDQVWIGTETRDPDSVEAGRRPQTAASWLQGWLNDLAGSKCGGAWYDPIDTSPETFVEQARQSILGGARESLLHCYDYLATTTPGLAIHGKDLEIRNGLADAEAFRLEADALQQLAERLAGMQPFGVVVPKAPGYDAPEEAYLPGFWSMTGIPVVAAADLRHAPAVLLGRQAAGFSLLPEYLKTIRSSDVTLLITESLLRWMRSRSDAAQILPEPLYRLNLDQPLPFFQRLTDRIGVIHPPADAWQMLALAPQELEALRQFFQASLGLALRAPAKVSLHLFRSARQQWEILENFNDEAVDVSLVWQDERVPVRNLQLALPANSAASMEQAGTIRLQPRSLAALYREI